MLVHHLRLRHQVEFYSFKSQYPRWLFPGRTDLDPSRQPLRIECEYLVHPYNPLTWLQTTWRIKRKVPDVLILQWWVPYWAPAFASIARLVRMLTQSKILYICHNVMPHETMGLSRLLAKLALVPGHHFIVHSDKDSTDLQSLLPGAPIQKAALPTYAALASNQPFQANAKQALGLDGKVILFFGFVREYKGLRYLLDAMPRVLEALKVHLLIVGEFWENRDRYWSLVEELGIADHVSIIDRYIPDEELGYYFGAADVVVLPYVHATQSAVIQLAFGFGKPVITTKVGGLAEVVKDGETGFVVAPADSEALATSVIQYFQEDKAVSFQRNIDQSKTRFEWDRLVELIERLSQDSASARV
jgi:glycosyltransferase involved in cell wall biosynthesis